MTKSEVAKLFEHIVQYYPSFSGDINKVEAWHKTLKSVSFDTALENLVKYARNPEHKFAPHPGILINQEITDRYIPSAQETREAWKTELEVKPVPPTPEQRAKIMQILGVRHE